MTMAGMAFLALLGLHLAVALVLNQSGLRGKLQSVLADRYVVVPAAPFLVLFLGRVRQRRPEGLALAALQTVLFTMAILFASRLGYLSRDLVSPIGIGAGLLAGHVIFGLSLMATHREAGDVAGHMTEFGPLWEYLVENPRVLTQFITVSVAEEMIYRAGLQPLLITWTGSAVAGIVIAAIAFSLVHDHFFRNSVVQSSEFLAFSLLLGVLFWWTGSLILVVVIHAVRNIEIAYIEHLARAEAAGTDAAADLEADFLSGSRSLVFLMTAGGDLPVACFEYAPEPAAPVAQTARA